jgi:hypothetical protein
MTHRDCSLTDRAMSYIGGGKLADEFAGNQTSERSSLGRVANELEAVFDRQRSGEQPRVSDALTPVMVGSQR